MSTYRAATLVIGALALAGCGSSQPSQGSPAWTEACSAITNDLPLNGVGDGRDPAGIGASNWDAAGAKLGALGYDSLHADSQKIVAAMRAGDQQGALSALTQFNLDKDSADLKNC